MTKRIQLLVARWLPAHSALGRLGRGTFWVSMGAGVSHILGMTSAILVAKLLGAVEFGQLSMLRSSVDMMTLFAGLALGATANRYVALYRSTDPDKAGRVIGMTTTIAWFTAGSAALLLILFAEKMAKILSAPSLVFEIRLIAAMLFFSAVSGAYSGILSGLESFKTQGTIASRVAMTAFPLVICGVFLAGVGGGVLALSSVSALSLFLSVRAVARLTKQMHIVSKFSWNSEQRRILQEFTAPALLSGLLVIPVFWIGNVILVGSPNGYKEMGLFAAANHWRQALVVIPSILGAVALPILSNLHGVRDYTTYLKILKTNLGVVAAMTLVPALILAAMSPVILGVYGSEFQVGWLAMVWLLVAGVFFALANVLGQMIASIGRVWIGLGLNICWACVFLAGAWAWCPTYGAVGLAGAYGFSYMIHAVLSLAIGLRLLSSVQKAGEELNESFSKVDGVSC